MRRSIQKPLPRYSFNYRFAYPTKKILWVYFFFFNVINLNKCCGRALFCRYCMSRCLPGSLTLKHILGSHLSQFYRARKEKTTFCYQSTFFHLAKWLSGLYCGSLSKNRMKTNCYHLRKPMTIMINEQIFLPSEVIA